MTDTELMDLVRKTLFDVAPDLEGEELEARETFHDQFEIDSMDFLNFVIGLAKATGVEIPESDYPRLQTPAGAVAYLRANWAAAST
ncbi:acyl carrier protein [Afifella pfennigii]|uniref:acyl carrier protein n=1 Tax=Afifella pfennigii TaxID=209897 RepID=UPI00047968AA|nr:acyl carrier protein [Afifella pfennigii]